MLNIENFINGEFVSTKSYLQSFNPATGEAHALVPDSSAEDVEKAVSAAEVAFERYSLVQMQLRLFFRVVVIIWTIFHFLYKKIESTHLMKTN